MAVAFYGVNAKSNTRQCYFTVHCQSVSAVCPL